MNIKTIYLYDIKLEETIEINNIRIYNKNNNIYLIKNCKFGEFFYFIYNIENKKFSFSKNDNFKNEIFIKFSCLLFNDEYKNTKFLVFSKKLIKYENHYYLFDISIYYLDNCNENIKNEIYEIIKLKFNYFKYFKVDLKKRNNYLINIILSKNNFLENQFLDQLIFNYEITNKFILNLFPKNNFYNFKIIDKDDNFKNYLIINYDTSEFNIEIQKYNLIFENELYLININFGKIENKFFSKIYNYNIEFGLNNNFKNNLTEKINNINNKNKKEKLIIININESIFLNLNIIFESILNKEQLIKIKNFLNFNNFYKFDSTVNLIDYEKNNKFYEKLDMKINSLILSFNLGGTKNFNQLDSFFINKITKYKPHLLVLNFQEIVELKIKSVSNFFITNSKNELVEEILFYYMKLFQCFIGYSLLFYDNLVGLLSMTFIRNDYIYLVNNFKSHKKGLGIMSFGNKGFISNEFEFNKIPFLFTNCHLESGYSEKKKLIRKNSLIKIKKSSDFKNHFIIGDMNLKLQCDLKEIIKNLENLTYNQLLIYDELDFYDLKGFYENEINFKPTFKYDIKTNEYILKPKKIPSYTDRIFYNNKDIEVLEYNSIDEVKNTDHKPVYIIFNI